MKTEASSRLWKIAGGALLALLVVAAIVLRRPKVTRRAEGAECRGVLACQAACDAADACACGVAGAFYVHGSSVARDSKRGLSLLNRACDAQCPAACWTLGTAYDTGAGVRADAASSQRYYERLDAMCERGCEAGSADHCFTLGGSYVNGHGVTPTPARAKELYTRSAELYEADCDKGISHACTRLAIQTDHGLGAGESKVRATELYEKACDLGDVESCEEASKRYDGRDKDLPHDDKRAADLAHKACAGGRALGCALSNEPEPFMQIVGEACAAGSSFDCGSAAFAFAHGSHGVPRDLSRAVPLARRMMELEQKACDDEDGSACAALARPYESGTAEGEPEGTLVKKDAALAAAFKKRACDLGYQASCGTSQGKPQGSPRGT